MAETYFPNRREGYTELPTFNDQGSNVFLKFLPEKPPNATRKPKVLLGYINIVDDLVPLKEDPYGSTGSQLYLELYIDPVRKDAFTLWVGEAWVDASISVRKKDKFRTSAEMGPFWEAYRAKGSAAAYAESMVTQEGNDWSAGFEGPRCRNVRHELQHVYEAQEAGQDKTDRFLSQIRKIQRHQGITAEKKVIDTAKIFLAMAQFPDADHSGVHHKKIAIDDVYFCLAQYALHVLEEEWPEPTLYKVWNEARHDLNFVRLMDRLGERYPWTA